MGTIKITISDHVFSCVVQTAQAKCLPIATWAKLVVVEAALASIPDAGEQARLARIAKKEQVKLIQEDQRQQAILTLAARRERTKNRLRRWLTVGEAGGPPMTRSQIIGRYKAKKDKDYAGILIDEILIELDQFNEPGVRPPDPGPRTVLESWKSDRAVAQDQQIEQITGPAMNWPDEGD